MTVYENPPTELHTYRKRIANNSALYPTSIDPSQIDRSRILNILIKMNLVSQKY